MKSTVFLLVLFAAFGIGRQEKTAPPTQEQTKDWKTRTVKGQEIISPAWPAVRLEFDAAYKYIGMTNFILYDVARAEQHFFVEADKEKRIRRLYWIQFEGYLPDNTHRYNYQSKTIVKLGGLDFFADSYARKIGTGGRPDSDGARAQKFLAEQGYQLASDQVLMQRLVHLTDETKRNELMMIYMEDLSPQNLTAADLAPSGKAAAQWEEIAKALLQRATQGVKVNSFNGNGQKADAQPVKDYYEKLRRARRLYGERKYEEVAPELAALAQRNPVDGNLWLMLATTHFQLRQYRQALEPYQKSLERGALDGATGAYQMARCQIALGEKDAALQWLERALAARYRYRARLAREDDWKDLRQDERFKQLALIHFETTQPAAKIYVLIGRTTFSAAQQFISTLSHLTGAVFVGEPSGSKPNRVGDEAQFILPYSGVMGALASGYHQAAAKDERLWIAPELPVVLTAADYFNQRDPVLEAVLEIIRSETDKH